MPLVIVRGIAEGAIYHVPVEITWVDPEGTTVAATLAEGTADPREYVEGTSVNASGSYTLTVVVTRTSDGETASTVFNFTLALAAPVIQSIPAQESVVGQDFYINLSDYVSDDGGPSTALAYALVSSPGELVGPVYHHKWDAQTSATVVFSATDSCGLASLGSVMVAVVPRIEFPADTIFVSPSGTDAGGSGLAPSSPCRTITFGIQEAYDLGYSRVVIASGVYGEQVVLKNGISLYGGYDESFTTRNLLTLRPIIQAPSGATETVRAVSISGSTTLEGVVIEGPLFVPSGTNSTALFLQDCGSGLAVRNCRIIAGRGGDGGVGTAGASGVAGVAGAAGSAPVLQTSYTGTNVGGSGGALSVSGTVVSGGTGGTAPVPTIDVQAGSGSPGSPPGGSGGAGGYSGQMGSSTTLNVPTSGPMTGSDGVQGAGGTNGSGGAGGIAGGSIVGGVWVAAAGSDGTNGTSGRGGGGGGAGGGVDDHLGNYVTTFVCILGPSGGGGGSGGGFGSHGTGGIGGGGAFCIVITFISAPGSLPVIESNQLSCGQAGSGGRGGVGGDHGHGGSGGAGVGGGACSSVHWTMANSGSGAGGAGGDGGYGGGGGGGAGGISAGILVNRLGYAGAITYESLNQIYISSGAGGAAGAGGWSPGTSGSSGSAGTVSSVLLFP